MNTITSGIALRTSCHAVSRLGLPSSARTGVPPTAAIMPGIQCPAENGGSDHSSANTPIVGRRLALSFPIAIEQPRDDADRRDHLGERVRVERDDPRVRQPELVERFLDLSARDGADA